ncbi:Protein PHOTOPERIOD-INDEPENDENT EARLY FLOWERING 1 [Zea mays]|uniref:DNA helicase n=2 Tax=Zea mays TaxID=4577 RepID=A0A1D6HGG5_MAIZE|nr:Protein PHOTOPERIOD-INDEPENDENT EARLY FLOWERING 1 [Zea mays]
MASKGPRSRLDHDTRARRQKALEAPREPRRPKVHWDHVLAEMLWLAKEFDSERKWKLSMAKKIAQRANKSIVDQAAKGERKQKEEEHRMRKVAVNISKDVKKFWIKIEKLASSFLSSNVIVNCDTTLDISFLKKTELYFATSFLSSNVMGKQVVYKHQLELEERKKKALDKQLDFLLGQTERYSTMLAENLVDMPYSQNLETETSQINQPSHQEVVAEENLNATIPDDLDNMEVDDDYGSSLDEEPEDDEHTIDEDEAQITEAERNEELAALEAEADLPLDVILKMYTKTKVSRESSPDSKYMLSNLGLKILIVVTPNQANGCDHELAHSSSDEGNSSEEVDDGHSYAEFVKKNHVHLLLSYMWVKVMEIFLLSMIRHVLVVYVVYGFIYSLSHEDEDYIAAEEVKDDEATLSEEEQLAKKEDPDHLEEIKLLQKESEIPLEELLARYREDGCADHETAELENSPHFVEEVNTDKSLNDQSVNILEAKSDIFVDHQSRDVLETEHTTLQSEIASEPCAQQNFVEENNLTDVKTVNEDKSDDVIADAAAAARSAQPTGNTFLTTKVRTKFPFLLKHSLREYQHIGLDWLVAMYEKRLNGILADEMGLGKTIMTISLLAHLACEKGIWGPHLIVVPTSVMLNWETEFLKWCPAFKILTYFGSAKERKQKRQGWMKPNYFHVCITTYRLVIQDSKVFKRKKWKYLILDEAHLIKNWKSQRWQTLLNFNSKRRILLTGTPLQNDLMELWSLMHFLMPHVFQSHQEFKDWFCNPISGMVEGQDKVNKEVIDRLHNVLRPFILRRLKRDVEKQLPKKHEHVIYCRLSRRQRNLYEEFVASSETQATLASGNYFGMISIIMQLRKVCNHPDLFEGRPIISSFDMAGINMQLSYSVCMLLDKSPFSQVDLSDMNFVFTQNEFSMSSWEADEVISAFPSSITSRDCDLDIFCSNKDHQGSNLTNIFEDIQKALQEERIKESRERAASVAWWNRVRCQKRPVYGTNMRHVLTVKHPVSNILNKRNNPLCHMDYSSRLADLVLPSVERFQKMLYFVESFTFAIPAARAPPPVCWCSKGKSPVFIDPAYREKCMYKFSPILSPIRSAIVRRQVYFPDRRLIQFDCGKLQELAILLRRLKSEGHRALIFTQMTKMLDVLEEFINLYGYTYLRLDGSTPPEERQTLMQRFNTNPKFFLFILSTRSGGVGINLVGADTVIFYDSDWNPAMDQQAQDRCHRIGQTREVHIYRLISESTIEENILKKANQKRALDDLVIQRGSYNTEFFKKLDPMEFFSGHTSLRVEGQEKNCSTSVGASNDVDLALSIADVEAAIRQAEDEADYMALKKLEEEEAVDNQEFSEEVAGRPEEDELVNEEDGKPDEHINEDHKYYSSDVEKEKHITLSTNRLNNEKALTLAVGDEDTDMLADVKQMAAAAAAAGQACSSFENQLRPIDRYAMRFMELWDPVIDKAAVNHQVNVEEEEWELDRIEKLKEDLEAEIDEDQEPLSYQSWDVDFATTAYRQHVEALTQKQLLEEQERQAQEAAKELEENNDNMSSHRRKSNKNKKKTGKFKSQKRPRLSSESEVILEETSVDTMSIDDNAPSPELISDESPHHYSNKRKKIMSATEEDSNSRSLKKFKKTKSSFISELSPRPKEDLNDSDPKSVARTKSDGRLSIPCMPVKRVIVIKPERLKKKGIWSRDCASDSWTSEEDAVLCGTVHEYGPLWELASDFLHSLPGGSSYRGRYHHPLHCCERYRELFCKYAISATDNSNSEKAPSGTGKAVLRVSEVS